MVRPDATVLINKLLDAAETVVERQGIANLTLDAVALEAGLSKGGLLYHFPSKDRLVEALVARSARSWRQCFSDGYERAEPGPGRQSRALLNHCLSDAAGWTRELRRSSSACFAALAQNPSLMQPMRDVYAELHRRVADDGLPPGVGEAVAAAIDGLWLYWVLGLAEVNQDLVVRVRGALEDLLRRSLPQPQATRAAMPGDDNAHAAGVTTAASAKTTPRRAAARPGRAAGPARTSSAAKAKKSAATNPATSGTSATKHANVTKTAAGTNKRAPAPAAAKRTSRSAGPAPADAAATPTTNSRRGATRSAAAAPATTRPVARRAADKLAAGPKKGLRP